MSGNRLGKGLEALIRPAEEQDVRRHPGVTEIEITRIKPNPHQPRKKFDDNTLAELTASIIEKGILTPVTVKPDGDNYILIAGERRLRASQSAGLKSIPAYVLNVDDEVDMVEMALIENIQRENLNAVEEAEGYAVLHSRFNLSQSQIAKAVGKSRVTITNALRLLSLPNEIKESIKDGLISAGHGRAILMVKTEKGMINLWTRILEKDLSVRVAESLASEAPVEKVLKRKISRGKKQDAVSAIENELIALLGTKVKLTPRKKGGILEVTYYSNEDLERILDMLRNLSD